MTDAEKLEAIRAITREMLDDCYQVDAMEWAPDWKCPRCRLEEVLDGRGQVTA